MKITSKLLIGLCLCLQMAHSLNPIVRKGNLLFDSVTGKQFWVKGVDYQPTDSTYERYDVLADPTTINRDIQLLKDLKINAIRVYQTESTNNHDVAMQILDAAGIYVILDVPTPTTSIIRDDPHWNADIFANFAAKIDAFAAYGNVLGYIASNEVSDAVNNSDASAFVKAAVRDVKAYARSRGLKTLIGYAIADAGSIAADQEAYFACSGDGPESPDFYGINIYRWCGNSTFQESGYDRLVQTFLNWPIAVILTEYGCIEPPNRFFGEVQAIYGPNMTSTISGGLVYEWSYEPNKYGLVQLNNRGNPNNDTVTPLGDYYRFKDQITTVNPSSTLTYDTYTYVAKTVACPAVSSTWLAASNPLPPAIDSTYCSCALSSFTCRFNANSAAEILTTYANNVTNVYNYVCQTQGLCDSVASNGETGTYGIYSACDALTRVSAVMDAFYQSKIEKRQAANCNFEGYGKIQTPSGRTCTRSTATSSIASTTRDTITTSASDASSTTSSRQTSSTGSTTGSGSGTENTGSGSGSGTFSGSLTQQDSSATALACGVIGIFVAALL